MRERCKDEVLIKLDGETSNDIEYFVKNDTKKRDRNQKNPPNSANNSQKDSTNRPKQPEILNDILDNRKTGTKKETDKSKSSEHLKETSNDIEDNTKKYTKENQNEISTAKYGTLPRNMEHFREIWNTSAKYGTLFSGEALKDRAPESPIKSINKVNKENQLIKSSNNKGDVHKEHRPLERTQKIKKDENKKILIDENHDSNVNSKLNVPLKKVSVSGEKEISPKLGKPNSGGSGEIDFGAGENLPESAQISPTSEKKEGGKVMNLRT